jgi:hypothetical protein
MGSLLDCVGEFDRSLNPRVLVHFISALLCAVCLKSKTQYYVRNGITFLVAPDTSLLQHLLAELAPKIFTGPGSGRPCQLVVMILYNPQLSGPQAHQSGILGGVV